MVGRKHSCKCRCLCNLQDPLGQEGCVIVSYWMWVVGPKLIALQEQQYMLLTTELSL